MKTKYIVKTALLLGGILLLSILLGSFAYGQISLTEGEMLSVSRSDINTPPEAATLLSPSYNITDTTPPSVWNPAGSVWSDRLDFEVRP